ncbi:PIF1-like helicase domain-containing protein [Pochonia chlamydosporia 170]|uniref:ATP-dependent DNA helicase n=1 Tax=Pochonia chlamydosporia 170 TaxID=1380566 RepID=A0A219ANQ3_METCM|nr:PIF1-like helicase domain-containing protein [Pochonia chlamydosporia 170]OWT42456.1 PIF1-like helicase domain-containing protein [Pochonia chlamydosporia 170]
MSASEFLESSPISIDDVPIDFELPVPPTPASSAESSLTPFSPPPTTLPTPDKYDTRLWGHFPGWVWSERSKDNYSWAWEYGYDIQHDDERRWVCKPCIQKNDPRPKNFVAIGLQNALNHLYKDHGISAPDNKTKSGLQKKAEEKPGSKRPRSIVDIWKLDPLRPREQAIANSMIRGFNRNHFQRLLIEWIVDTNQPFSVVEHERLRDIFEYLNPAVKITNANISDTTVRALINSEFKKHKARVIEALRKSPGLIHVSFDGWRARNRHSLYGIVCFFRDENSKPHKVALGVPEVRRHSGNNIATEVLYTIEAFGIEENIGYFTLDNAENNDTALEAIGKKLGFNGARRRGRCFGHIVNLSAKALLAAIEDVLNGFGEQDIRVTAAHPKGRSLDSSPQAKVRLGPSTSFLQAGRRLVELFTLNRRQSVAFLLICRRLDSIRGHGAAAGQLCEFIGGEGGTGKSRVIEALVELFASAGISNRVLVTATSGTAAAQINGITIHSACGFLKDRVSRVGVSRDIDGANLSNSAERFINGQSRMDWQEKYLLIIDEVSMLGARTLYAVNERLCRLRGCQRDFGGIPIVLFCGDFRQFRPVQERSILLPSTAVTWDEDTSFGPEQRHQHDRAHALWRRFTTVVMLDEQVRAAGDPELQQLLKRIRRGVQNRTDLDLLNSRCYREDRPIPWETGITVVTPLNRNRWNLNMEATLSFQRQHRETMRIFISEHRWKDGQASEEEAILMLNHGDNSAIPVPAIFMFVPGMPIVVNHNTHQGLKLVNGASYTALDVILDKAYPGHRISADTMLHFGPPAGILLAAKTTQEFHFVGMPPGTILLTPMSVSIRAQRNRPWQVRDVARKGLPCAAAFACTDYKVQAKTLERVALELRGTRTTNVNGQMVASQCDPYSLYVQLSRCPSLDGIMLVSKVRERDLVGNTVPEDMTAAEERLEALSKKTMQEAHDLIG